MSYVDRTSAAAADGDDDDDKSDDIAAVSAVRVTAQCTVYHIIPLPSRLTDT